ncbi:MAG TPA: multicopper oxidase domain-containing protein [Geomonas sp.]|nr:multicopper oxidase domain-containing protein [Geomonas sp.]
MWASSALANQQVVQTVLDPAVTPIPHFVEPLPTFNGNRADGTKPLTVTAQEFQQRVLPASFYAALPGSVTYRDTATGAAVATINPQLGTYLWGYQVSDGTTTIGPSYPAVTIVAQQGVPTQVHYVNNLVPFGNLAGPLLQKFLTVDLSLHWSNPTNLPMTVPDATSGAMVGNPAFYSGPQPMVVHLHGGEIPSAFDGNPDSWFTPGAAIKGSAFVTDTYTYPNTQSPATLWYHDHVLGETRLNVYAGLAGFYFLRGAAESEVSPALPSGSQEVELAIQDRMFDSNGQLYFPDGNPPGGGLNGDPGNPTLHPYAVPEFFGNVMIVNGKSWPYLEVEPRRYRLRFLNGCNARTLGMTLVDQNNQPGPAIWQIGSDGGLLDKPAPMVTPSDAPPPFGPGLAVNLPAGAPVPPQLFLAPGERADVVVDFSGMAGKSFTLTNGAPAPFPSGGTQFDPALQGQIMQFRVSKPLSSPDTSFNPASSGATLRTGVNKMVRLADGLGGLGSGVKVDNVRRVVLIEKEGPTGTGGGGPAEVLLDNAHYDGISEITGLPIPGSKQFNGPGSPWVTEIPANGSTETWEIVNLTPDAHPIHLHLVQFQLMNRQVFNVGDVEPPFTTSPSYRTDAWEPAFLGGSTLWDDGLPVSPLLGPYVPDPTSYLTGNLLPPDPNEAGWKDTVKSFPGTITRVAVRFAPQDVPLAGVGAGINTFAFDPSATMSVVRDAFGYPGGPGYVWHCHILDHEDNDMMRPYQVTAGTIPHDGIVNAAPGKLSPDLGDALTILRYIDGDTALSEPQKTHADVAPLTGPNGAPVGDGTVDSGDVLMILRRIVGIGRW